MKLENNPFETTPLTKPNSGGNVVNLPANPAPEAPPDYEDIPASVYEEGQMPIPEGGSYKPSGTKKFTSTSGHSFFEGKGVNWLVQGIIEADSKAVCFAPSGIGKSFFAFDLALHIATGNVWHGHKVKQGKVLYVANGEGLNGRNRRITAWAQRYGNHTVIGANFHYLDQQCVLPDDGELLAEHLAEIGDVRLLVIDTLQQSFSGNPDSTADMVAYTRALNEIKKAIPDLTILIVHHTGHSTTERGMGSVALKNQLDTEIRIEQRGRHRVIECTKSKESEPFKPLAFELKTEILEGWKGEEGELVTSATLHLDSDFDCNQSKAGKVAKGKNPKAAMVVLHSLIDAQRRNLELNDHDPADAKVLISDWIESCRGNPEITQRYLSPSMFFNRISSTLVDQGIVATEGEYVRLSE